ncbi:MAG: FAD-dependent thymidylate synthase [Dissulfurispiraceae bacterium]
MKQCRANESAGIKEMHMEVGILGISMPVVDKLDISGECLGLRSSQADELLATAGRTCYQSFSKQNGDGDKALVRYMGQIGHYSVLEHCSVTIVARGGSRAFTHQLVRHRHTGFSQESQRYCDEGNFGYIIPPSIKEAGLEDEFKQNMELFRVKYMDLQEKLKIAKKEGRLAPNRKANEDARFYLPNAVASEIVFTPNFGELRHMFKKRLTTHAQWEIFECFRQVLEKISRISCAFDDIKEHFDEHGNLDTFKDRG